MSLLTQLELQISDAVQVAAWQQRQTCPTPRAQWSAYINQLCVDTIVLWLQEDYGIIPRVQLHAWGILNGTALLVNQKRLILIPDKSIDTSELRVPQEWIDVPSLVGDYYLGVQVNSDERSVQVCGYATHEQFKTKGQYDADDRTYALDRYELVPEFQVLWVVQQLFPDEPTRSEVALLGDISQAQAENLLLRLAQKPIDQIRLELPFPAWAALLESETWRQRLYHLQNRSNNLAIVTNLTQWFQDTVDQTWQSIETFLGSEQAAFSLRLNDAEATIRRAKALSMPDQAILLVVGLNAEVDQRVGVRIQLRSIDQTLCLPEHLVLSLLSSEGDTIQSVQTHRQDDLIQLQRFKCAVGTQFQVQVRYLDAVITEDFRC